MRKFAAIAIAGLIGITALAPQAHAANWFSRTNSETAQQRQDRERWERDQAQYRHDNGNHYGWYKKHKGTSYVRGYNGYNGYNGYRNGTSYGYNSDTINSRLQQIRNSKAGEERQRLQREFYQDFPNYPR